MEKPQNVLPNKIQILNDTRFNWRAKEEQDYELLYYNLEKLETVSSDVILEITFSRYLTSLSL